MDRRDFLVSILQALFLALFPWLRTERGAEVLKAAVEDMVPTHAVFKTGEFRITMGIKGFELSDEWMAAVRKYPTFEGMIRADDDVEVRP